MRDGVLVGVRVAPGVASESLGDAFVVVDPATGRAHLLEGEVAGVWAAVSEHRAAPDLSPARAREIAAGLVEQGLLVGAEGVSRRAVLQAAGAGVAVIGLTSVALPAVAEAGSKSTGAVQAWGYNNDGQLGNNSTTDSHVPVGVQLPTGVVATGVAAGQEHSLAVTSTGAVYAWGVNNHGQLGNNTTTNSDVPLAVQLPGGVIATGVSAGEYHSLAVTSTGAVYAWGFNANGQLGISTTTDSHVPVLVQLPTGTVATSVGAGLESSVALTSTGAVYAWGSNAQGQLGNNTTTDSHVPVLVQLPTGVVATAIAGGYEHNLAVTPSGAVYAWGANVYGEIGNNTTTQSPLPVLAQLPSGVVATGVAAAVHSLALTSTGAVYAWGNNTEGELGNGTTTDSHVPVLVDLPNGVVATGVAAGFEHSLALTSAGAVYAWGYNNAGQLGIGTTANSDVPALSQLPAGSQATVVGSGSNAEHTLAVI